MQEELEQFKWGISQKLKESATELASQATRVGEAEWTIIEIETWNMEVKDALLISLKQQKLLQEKLIEQEGRSRRNNICIFGLAENVDSSSISQFVEQLLKTEFSVPADIDLQIQWAHRLLVPKPNPDQPPRSVIVTFL